MEFKIENINIYGLEQSIGASGYPKAVGDAVNLTLDESDWKRAKVLGAAKSGSGHDCFLKGIVVQWDITASHAFWMQYLRYHFSDIISSQSKMHKITSMDIALQCNSYVDRRTIRLCEDLVNEYLDSKAPEDFERLIHNLPMGLMLTARCTDNYLSIKSQYHQRKTDKLKEWGEYCFVVESLPEFKVLIGA